jgi:ubiquinol-cytochrome c reductase cytochrome c subunit
MSGAIRSRLAAVQKTFSHSSRRARPRWFRRVTSGLALLLALGLVGAVYSIVAPSSNAADSSSSAVNVSKGKALFDKTCITCHGANLQGVEDRGPSLIGVGQAAAYFQLSTGRMPLGQQGPQAERKYPKFTAEEIQQIAAYVQVAGNGGPTIPSGNLRDGSLGEGGELFRLNCASCHSLTGQGGALSGGKFAPSLKDATDAEIYAAMQTGPESMPIFGDNQITPEQKRAIINYVQSLKEEGNAGGFGIGRLGPVSEGLIAWVVGISVLLLIIFWIGAKSGTRSPAVHGAGHGTDGVGLKDDNDTEPRA